MLCYERAAEPMRFRIGLPPLSYSIPSTGILRKIHITPA